MKYKSITTPNIFHDEFNLLVEVLMLNRYGRLSPYIWRKNNPLSKEWSSTLKLIKALVKRNSLSVKKLAWYFYKFHITELDSKNIGLNIWKIKHLFKDMSLEDLSLVYSEKMKDDDIIIISDYSFKRKNSQSLLDILKDIESGQEKK